jgi:hypothetical protein
MRPQSPEHELRMIESCIVAPDERRLGRTYERVQEILLELYTLRQRAGGEITPHLAVVHEKDSPQPLPDE